MLSNKKNLDIAGAPVNMHDCNRACLLQTPKQNCFTQSGSYFCTLDNICENFALMVQSYNMITTTHVPH